MGFLARPRSTCLPFKPIECIPWLFIQDRDWDQELRDDDDNYSSNLRVEATYRGKFGCGGVSQGQTSPKAMSATDAGNKASDDRLHPLVCPSSPARLRQARDGSFISLVTKKWLFLADAWCSELDLTRLSFPTQCWRNCS